MRIKIKKFLFLIAIIVLVFLLCTGDNGGNNLEIKTSPPNNNLIDLVSKIYDESQLSELVNIDGSMNELHGKYSIECLRSDKGIYRASYLGDGYVAVVLFDESGNKLIGKVYKTQLLKSDFCELEKGKSVEDVRKLDPNGDYVFLYTGRDDMPKASSHYTKDGYLITIEYDTFNKIISINAELI